MKTIADFKPPDLGDAIDGLFLALIGNDVARMASKMTYTRQTDPAIRITIELKKDGRFRA